MADLPQNIVDARNTAQAAGSALGDYRAGSYTIADQLKKTVQEALDYNKDIITQRSGALSDYLAAPQAAANQFGVKDFTVGPNAGQQNQDYIFNPFERNAAIARSIQNKEIPFMTLNALLGMREGTTADTVRAGTGAYNAATARAEGVAQNAQQNYSSILNEYVTQQDILAKQRQLEQEDQRIQLAREAAARAGSGGGGLTLPDGFGSGPLQYNPNNMVVDPSVSQWLGAPDASAYITDAPDQFNWLGEAANQVSQFPARIGDAWNSLTSNWNQETQRREAAKAAAPWYKQIFM